MILEAKVLKANPDHTADLKVLETAEELRGVRKTGRVIWNLQAGDLVLFTYLGNDMLSPIIIDVLRTQQSPLVQEATLEGIHLKHEVKDTEGNITGSVEIITDETGKAIVKLSGGIEMNVAGEESEIKLSSEGALTIITENDLSVQSNKGKVSVNAKSDVDVNTEGSAKVISKGDVTVESKAPNGKVTAKAMTVNIDAVSVNLGKNPAKQLACNLPACIVTGAPHSIGNTGVKL